jgi:hypothetical protein
LQRALREIARIEHELRAFGDRAALKRFIDPGHGFSIAALLGYHLLTVSEACVVAQLSRMPEALNLVRNYLRSLGTPHVSETGQERTLNAGNPAWAPGHPRSA